MNIKTKLYFLVFINLSMFAVAVGCYLLVISPIDLIDQEYTQFSQTELAVRDLQIEASKLMNANLVKQKLSYDLAFKNYEDAFAKLASLTYLPRVNQALAGAIDVVAKLKELGSSSLKALEKSLTDLLSVAAEENNTQLGSIIDLSIYSASSTDVGRGRLRSMVRDFASREASAQIILLITVEKLAAQDDVVANEIGLVKARAFLIVGIVVSLCATLLLIFSFLLSRSIARSLKSIQNQVQIMSTGDLRGRFNTRSKDEIGRLSKNLDLLLEALHSSIGKIKDASETNIELRNHLGQAVSTATSSAIEIEANTASIRAQMLTMDNMVREADGRSRGVADGVASYRGRIAEQGTHVETSTVAVTDMISSLEKVSHIAELDREAANSLVRESESGREIFEDSFAKVASISEQVSAIQEMSDVIAKIASQTNILAMNAAIEAAHAGDLGRGFAVVADEIGKLAAASAASSGEIAETIRTITQSISEADATREGTSKAFDSISLKISAVAESITEIVKNIQDMRAGGRQVLDTMQSLRAGSTVIIDEAATIGDNTKQLAVSFLDLSRLSGEVTSNIGEIVIGLQEINQAVHQVSDHSHQIGEVGQSLVESVKVFKV